MCNDESNPRAKKSATEVPAVFQVADGEDVHIVRGNVERTEEETRLILKYSYPDILFDGAEVTGRDFAGTVTAVDGRILTIEE